MADFFYMGGFGAYIWSAMGAALFFMLLEPLMLGIKRKAVIKEIKRANRLSDRRERDNRTS